MATQNDNNPTIEAGGNPSPSTASPFLSTSSSSTTPTTTTNPVTPKPTDTAHQGSAPNTNPNDLGIGKAAGAIVGALVGGLLLGFVAAFVLLRHRAQHHSRRHSKSKRRRNSEKFFTSQEGSKPPKDDFGPQINAWESHLPQPADDNALRLRMKTFFHQAELHVEHFYTDAKSSSTRMANASTHSELSLFDSGQLPAPLAAVMPQTGSKMKVIKHSLIYFILGKISPEAHIPPSFLPIEYAALPSALERAKPEKNKSGAKEIFSRWRVMTAYLRPDTTTDEEYIKKRDSAIAEAASAFSAAFAPWAVASQTHQARCQNLAEIMRSAADMGNLIFSQPSAFGYDWNTPSSARRERAIVVMPAVVKLTDEHAVSLSRPLVIVQQIVDDI